MTAGGREATVAEVANIEHRLVAVKLPPEEAAENHDRQREAGHH
jgi:hypothetical protein